jgi:hypothetical protein
LIGDHAAALVARASCGLYVPPPLPLPQDDTIESIMAYNAAIKSATLPGRHRTVGSGRDGAAAALLRANSKEERAFAVCHYPLCERDRRAILTLPPSVPVEASMLPPAYVAVSAPVVAEPVDPSAQQQPAESVEGAASSDVSMVDVAPVVASAPIVAEPEAELAPLTQEQLEEPSSFCTELKSKCITHALWQETRRAELSQMVNLHVRHFL